MESDESNAGAPHGSDVVVDGRGFDVEHIGQDRYSPTFELRVMVEESRGETPEHEFRKVLEPGGRSDLTDEYVEKVVQKWSDGHEDFTVEAFAVEELSPARVGRLVNNE